jgi:hypothetical protein
MKAVYSSSARKVKRGGAAEKPQELALQIIRNITKKVFQSHLKSSRGDELFSTSLDL